MACMHYSSYFKKPLFWSLDTTLGNCDFEIGRGYDKVKEFKEVVLVGEVKIPQNNKAHTAESYCDYGCSDPNCKKERHNPVSVVRQLYNYMVVNGLFFGLFSSHKYWAGFIRDCEGSLFITPTIAFDQDQPYTAAQFLVLFYKLASMRTLPDCIGKYTSLVKCVSPDCKHIRLPE